MFILAVSMISFTLFKYDQISMYLQVACKIHTYFIVTFWMVTWEGKVRGNSDKWWQWRGSKNCYFCGSPQKSKFKQQEVNTGCNVIAFLKITETCILSEFLFLFLFFFIDQIHTVPVFLFLGYGYSRGWKHIPNRNWKLPPYPSKGARCTGK